MGRKSNPPTNSTAPRQPQVSRRKPLWQSSFENVYITCCHSNPSRATPQEINLFNNKFSLLYDLQYSWVSFSKVEEIYLQPAACRTFAQASSDTLPYSQNRLLAYEFHHIYSPVFPAGSARHRTPNSDKIHSV